MKNIMRLRMRVKNKTEKVKRKKKREEQEQRQKIKSRSWRKERQWIRKDKNGRGKWLNFIFNRMSILWNFRNIKEKEEDRTRKDLRNCCNKLKYNGKNNKLIKYVIN